MEQLSFKTKGKNDSKIEFSIDLPENAQKWAQIFR